MDMHPRLLLISFALLGLLSHCILATIPCEGYSRCRYIIRVRPPPDFSLDDTSTRNLESWYRSFLPAELAEFGGKPPFIHTYKEAMVGFAMNLAKDEVDYMKKKDGVLMVYQDVLIPLHTTHTPDFLGLRQPNNGGAWKRAGMGEGSIIGLLDTGIDFAHASFNDDGMSPPPAKWRGSCKFEGVKCNKKLIGARSMLGGGDPPSDDNGHGTHTASTAAGNFVPGASVLGSGKGIAAGMAPRAHLAMYQVCDQEGCSGADILAGVEAAINDGVDILSISLGERSKPFYADILSIATFSATQKGIFVSCSAGNSGPSPQSLSNEAPWVLSVGASTMDRRMKAIVKLGDGRSFVGESAYQPSKNLGFLPVVFDEDASGDIKGKVASAKIDGAYVDFGEAVKADGGSGIILLGIDNSGDTTLADAHVLPASYVNFPDGEKIRQYILKSNKPTASILFNGTSVGNSPAPVVAYFSSRGPSTSSPGILKPDIIGPGVNIIAAWPLKVGPTDVDGQEKMTFNTLSGTSMATPHLSGIAAIIRSAHPDWSPSAIKSAIMTTAYFTYDNDKPILDEKLNPAGHFTIGAGHVNPSKAVNPGLIYDIDGEQYIFYLCGLGYSDSQVEMVTHRKNACKNGRKISEAELNYPSIATKASVGKLVVNRTVTNVEDARSSYVVSIDMPKEVEAVVTPAKMEFTKAKEKKTFTVSLRWNPRKTKYAEGSFKWVSQKRVVRSPIVIF